MKNWNSISCAIFGHCVDHSGKNVCRCGASILAAKDSCTRIRHVVSCFLRGHRYTFVAARDDHEEYACTICGHPLLFAIGKNPFSQKKRFEKKVRYLCNLFGHNVHFVVERDGFAEYACDCGHTFLKSARNLTAVKHPLICLFAGHFVNVTRSGSGWNEFVCENCGHTFLLGPEFRSTLEMHSLAVEA